MVKVAVHERAWSTVTATLALPPAQAPAQLVKSEPVAGTAVSVTLVP